MRRSIVPLILVLLTCLMGASAASADGTTGVLSGASFTPAAPATAGSGDTTTATLSFSYAGSSDTAHSLTITLPPGFLAAPAAVPATCSSSQLAAASCPAASQIGSGTASVVAIGLVPATADLSVYLMPAPNANSVVGVGVVLSDAALGVTTETSGTGGFITGPTGQPQLQIALPSLPEQVTALGLTLGIQLTQMTMVLDGQSASGQQFLYLPTACASAPASFLVGTKDGSSGTATASFTPSGCPLSYRGGSVGAAAQSTDSSNDAAFQTMVSFPSGGANTTGVSIDIPTTALRANPLYAALSCSTSPPFTGCTPIGSVGATTPLLAAPLTGTAYLTGSALGGYGLGLVFPPPINLNLSGSVSSANGVTEVTFPAVPDLPLRTLELSLTGGQSAAFQTSCGAGPQTISGTLTGAGGAGNVTPSSPIAITGCPNVDANGGGSQVADYGNPSAPAAATAAQIAPRLSALSLSPITTARDPRLAFRLSAGSAALSGVTVTLPAGLSFNARTLARELHLSVGAHARLSHGRLILSFDRAVRSVTVRIDSRGLSATPALRRAVLGHTRPKLLFVFATRLAGAAGHPLAGTVRASA